MHASNDHAFHHSHTEIITDQVIVGRPAFNDPLRLCGAVLVVCQSIASYHISFHIMQANPGIGASLLLRVAQDQIPRDDLLIPSRCFDPPLLVVRTHAVTDDIVMITPSCNTSDPGESILR